MLCTYKKEINFLKNTFLLVLFLYSYGKTSAACIPNKLPPCSGLNANACLYTEIIRYGILIKNNSKEDLHSLTSR